MKHRTIEKDEKVFVEDPNIRLLKKGFTAADRFVIKKFLDGSISPKEAAELELELKRNRKKSK